MVTGTAPARRVGLWFPIGDLNVTTITGWQLFDAAVRWAAPAPKVTYRRDVANRVIERSLNGVVLSRYAHTATVDSPSLTLTAGGTVAEITLSLPGGVLLTKTATTQTWSYPNLHGDVVATTDSAGTKQGGTLAYDPFGNGLSSAELPDNSAGAWDYQWHGQQQRPTEHQAGLTPTIEMGARQYLPAIGRFIQADPIPGGCANSYTYGFGDPLSSNDLSGMADSSWACDILQAMSWVPSKPSIATIPGLASEANKGRAWRGLGQILRQAAREGISLTSKHPLMFFAGLMSTILDVAFCRGGTGSTPITDDQHFDRRIGRSGMMVYSLTLNPTNPRQNVCGVGVPSNLITSDGRSTSAWNRWMLQSLSCAQREYGVGPG